MTNRTRNAKSPPEQIGRHLPRIHTFSSLQHVNFRYLWASTIFSSAADWVQMVTLGWYMYELSGSAILVGSLQACRAAPFLVAGPLSGVLTDRVDRRKFLLFNHIFLSLVALLMALLVQTGEVRVWHLFAFGIVSGIGFAAGYPLRQTMVPDVVPRPSVSNGIALVAMAMGVNRILGPATGGILIALFGPSTNFFIQAICYLGVTAMVFPIRLEHKNAARAHTSPLADLREGMVFVLTDKKILSLILLGTIPTVFLMPYTIALLPVFSKDVLGQGPDGLGLLMALFGVGGLVGSLAVATLNSRNPTWSVAAGAFSAVAMMALSRANSMEVALMFLVLEGIGQTIFFVMNNAALQIITPDHMRGRVMGIYYLNGGISFVGSFLAGLVARASSPAFALLTGGVLVVGLLILAGVAFKGALRAAKEALASGA